MGHGIPVSPQVAGYILHEWLLGSVHLIIINEDLESLFLILNIIKLINTFIAQ